MPTGIKINGRVHDFASIETSIAGLKFPNILEINYSDKLDKGKRRNRSGKVSGRTHGDYDAEGDTSLPKADSNELLTKLDGEGEEGFGMVAFNASVSYADGDDEPITDTLVGCMVVGNEASNAQGNEQTVVKHTLDIIEIKWGGKQMSKLGTR